MCEEERLPCLVATDSEIVCENADAIEKTSENVIQDVYTATICENNDVIVSEVERSDVPKDTITLSDESKCNRDDSSDSHSSVDEVQNENNNETDKSKKKKVS